MLLRGVDAHSAGFMILTRISYSVDTKTGKIEFEEFKFSHYLGNVNTKEVQDLNNQKNSCQINEIKKANHAISFKDDSLEEIHEMGCDNCHWCIGDAMR